ncbi:MAG TPA: anti-sigma F factor [Thermaerobacter sp.]
MATRDNGQPMREPQSHRDPQQQAQPAHAGQPAEGESGTARPRSRRPERPAGQDGTAAHRWMELRLASVPENVGIARVAVAAFAGQLPFTLSEIEEIKVAVSEAVTNAIVHGYGHPHGVVTVRAEHNGSRLLVVVEDRGRGIEDVEQARQPAFSTDPERMGMGFAFMEAFMDEVGVESAVGVGTTVRLYKRPRPQEGAAAGDAPRSQAGKSGPDAADAARLEAAAGLGDGAREAGSGGRR